MAEEKEISRCMLYYDFEIPLIEFHKNYDLSSG